MHPHRRGRALTFEDTLRTDMKYQECAVNTTARSFIPAAQSCTRPCNPAPASSMDEESATRRGPSYVSRLSGERSREGFVPLGPISYYTNVYTKLWR